MIIFIICYRVGNREEEEEIVTTYGRVLLRRFGMREDVHVAVWIRPRVQVGGHY